MLRVLDNVSGNKALIKVLESVLIQGTMNKTMYTRYKSRTGVRGVSYCCYSYTVIIVKQKRKRVRDEAVPADSCHESFVG